MKAIVVTDRDAERRTGKTIVSLAA